MGSRHTEVSHMSWRINIAREERHKVVISHSVLREVSSAQF